MTFSVLYRGLLSSCNYACRYCPFAKRTESPRRLAEDRVGLERFEQWLLRERDHQWRILFTPWGEALVRSCYRDTIARLTHADHIEQVAAQTNLSCGLRWLDDCRIERLALWATYHPGEASRRRFVEQVLRVRDQGARISVGVVGAFEHFDEIAELRRELPPDQYVWINALQPRPRPYTEAEVEFLTGIDPCFPLTLRPQRSFGLPCRTGEASFTVDASGDMRRCHFVDAVIGNIERGEWLTTLRPRTCPKRLCHCFLGLAEFEPSRLRDVFGEDVLARILDQDAGGNCTH